MRRRFRDNLLGVNCGALTGLGTLSPLPATLESSPVTWESLLPGGLESEPCWVEGLGTLKPQLGRGGGGMWGLSGRANYLATRQDSTDIVRARRCPYLPTRIT